MHTRVVLGVGKGVLFREVSSVRECPHREREVPLYPSLPPSFPPSQGGHGQSLWVWGMDWGMQWPTVNMTSLGSPHLISAQTTPRPHPQRAERSACRFPYTQFFVL